MPLKTTPTHTHTQLPRINRRRNLVCVLLLFSMLSTLSRAAAATTTLGRRWGCRRAFAFVPRPSSSSSSFPSHLAAASQPRRHHPSALYSTESSSSTTPGTTLPPQSSSSSSEAEEERASDTITAAPKRQRPRRTVTGGLKNLPITPPANELVNRAVRASQYLKIDEEKVKNQRLRARKQGALRLDTLSKMLSKPLKDTIKAYEYELSVLHPFEATLADLTVRARAKQGHQSLSEVLGAVNDLRKEVLETGKHYIALAKNATTKIEAIQATEEGFQTVQDLVLGQAETITNLIKSKRPCVKSHRATRHPYCRVGGCPQRGEVVDCPSYFLWDA